MLGICAPSAKIIEFGDHRYAVKFNGKIYPGLPKGKHGVKPQRSEIKIGKVRHMIDLLGIDRECAFKQLGLPIKPKKDEEKIPPPAVSAQ